MKTDSSEYLPEKDSVFKLERKEDPSQLLAIRLREQVCDDANLSDGAVRMFVRLLDLALNPMLNNGRRGQIIISQQKLGEFIGCDERSIRRRTDELRNGNYFWTQLIGRQNTKPIYAYNMTAFIPKKQAAQDMPGEGLWGNGKRRYDHGFAKTGSEATGRQRRVGNGLVDRFGRQIIFNYLENAPARGQNGEFTPDKNDRSDRTPSSAGSGQNCPLTEDTSVRCERSALSGASGQKRPLGVDAGVRHIESQNKSETRKLISKSSSKGLKPSDSRGEDDFVQRLTSLAIGHDGEKAGMLQSRDFGKQWRMRFREDPEKANRVYADTAAAAREGEITGKVGEYFNYRWKEFASRKATV